MNGILTRTLTVLGIGAVVSLVAGLLIGWLIGDVAQGVGTTIWIGMSVTAVVCVAVGLLPRRG